MGFSDRSLNVVTPSVSPDLPINRESFEVITISWTWAESVCIFCINAQLVPRSMRLTYT